MNVEASREVPVEVIPPGAPEPRPPSGGSVPFEGIKTFYHPASGVVILGLDWLIFGTDFLTGFLALPVMCVVGFIVSFVALMAIQLSWSKDTKPAAMTKAFMGAFLVGIPLPITGTLLGAAILALSGLPRHPADAIKKLAAQHAK